MYPKVSWTALDRFERCSYSAKLKVERKRSMIPVEHVLVGNALHYGLSAFIDVGISVQEAALWDFQRRVYEEHPRWDREKLSEQLERVRSGALSVQESISQLAGGGLLRTEVRLLKTYPTWAIDGYVDLMVGRGDQVWDLKTGRWHSDQLVFYDVICQLILGLHPTTVGVIEPFGRGLVPVTVADEHRFDMVARMKVFVERMRADDFAFEGYRDECGRCPSKAFCPRWDAARSGVLGA